MNKLNKMVMDYLEEEYGLNCFLEYEDLSIERVSFITKGDEKFKISYNLDEPSEDTFAPDKYLLHYEVEKIPYTSGHGAAIACDLSDWKKKLNDNLQVVINRHNLQIEKIQKQLKLF